MSAIDRMVAAARSRLARLRPAAAVAAVDDGALLIDIRPVWQREEAGDVPGAVVVERNHLEWRCDPDSGASLPQVRGFGDPRLIVICEEGWTSSLAAAALIDLGHPDATDVIGGTTAWIADGLALQQPGGRLPTRPEDLAGPAAPAPH